MSKKSRPTTEELRFVYDLILKGYDDADILAEYAHLLDMGQLMFPVRTDKRFIRECRKELEAATEVTREHLKKKVDPFIVKRREEHFSNLAGIAKVFLNNLDSVSSPRWTTNRSRQVKYVIPNKKAASRYDEITEEQLTGCLNSNIASAIDKHGDWFFRACFVPHLKSELPEELKTELFYNVVEKHPYKLIETLRILTARKTFKGTCPVCKDW